MKILLAVDGSPCTRRMLAYIAAHDELLRAGHEFTALTVVAPIPQHAASFLSTDVIHAYYAEQAEEVLKPVRAFAEQQGWTLDARQVVGHAGDAIAELAESGKYDLVVMGSHGHSALTGAVLGSVATRVLAKCKVPVLLVR
ncbi:MAG: universal stress protein [Pseudomonadota bacterium]